MKRDLVSQALNSLEDRHITDTERFSPETVQRTPERIAYMKKKRLITFALAAVLLLAFGITAYAVRGAARSTGTHPMPGTADYTSLSALPEIEKKVGYPVTVPADFSNGYAFVNLRVVGQAVFGESNEVLEEFYGVNVSYARKDAPELTLHLHPVTRTEGEGQTPAREPGEQRTVDGVTVELNLDRYKFVPEDYEKTEEDLALEEAGHYFISFGADETEERQVASAEFRLGDVVYTLLDMAAEEDALDTLSTMAGEIIRTAGTK